MDFNWRFRPFISAKLNTPTDFAPSTWNTVANPNYDDSSWKKINVPHDFIIEGTFNPNDTTAGGTPKWNDHGYLPLGVGWYRKTFNIKKGKLQGQSAWIDFDGVYRNSTVWINGKLLGNHPSGYTSFRYKLNGHNQTLLKEGSNCLVVRADAILKEGWFYEGGGIYRHVWLTLADNIHVEPWGIRVLSNLKSSIKDGSATVELDILTVLRNDATINTQVHVRSIVLDSTGKSLGTADSTVSIASSGMTTPLNQTILIDNVKLWSLETPVMYRLSTTILDTLVNQAYDNVITRFSPRKITFDPNQGMFLNDKHVKLQGMANHMDFAGVGSAVPDRIQSFKIMQMKSMGVNAWRCAHNPPNPEFLDAADDLGILVLDENRHFGIQPNWDILPQGGPAAWDPANIDDLRSMVLRDRNHPSIFAWSLCNEPECLLENDTISAKAGKLYTNIIKELDPSRFVTGAMNSHFGEGLGSVLDIQGFNYNDGKYDDFHKKYPNTPTLATETTNGNEDRGEYISPDYISSFSTNHEGWWKDQASRPFMVGGFAWTGYDYKGECSWPSVNSHFGTVDIAGFPKDRFFWYKAYWTNQPVLHLIPSLSPAGDSCNADSFILNKNTQGYGLTKNLTATTLEECVQACCADNECDTYNFCVPETGSTCERNTCWIGHANSHNIYPGWRGGTKQNSRIMVFTNADEVEIFVDNITIGRKVVPFLGHQDWKGFQISGPGNIHAFGYRTNETDPFVDTVLERAGKPYAVVLIFEMDQKNVTADGQDVGIVAANVIDSQSRIVTSADQMLHFTITGPGRIIGVGNGDPHCHELEKANTRSVFHGMARVIVQSTGNVGTIKLQADASGLKSGEITFAAIPPSTK